MGFRKVGGCLSARQESAGRKGRPGEKESAAMLKALLVDDDHMVTTGLSKLIPWGELNATLIGEANNGKAALRFAEENRPDLIISDIRMPVMDGLELCRVISSTMFDTTVILLSAYEDFTYAQTALQYGVKDYILKPMNWEKIDQLTGKIRAMSQRLEMRKQLYAEMTVQENQKQLSDIIRFGKEDELAAYLDTLFEKYSIDCDMVKELSFKLAGFLFRFLSDLNMGFDAVLQKEEVIGHLFSLKSMGELRDYTFGLYRDLLRGIDEKKHIRAKNLAEEADRYINAQFTDPAMTVASVADRFHITANYLSILFRQAKGINISAYITGLRIARAKTLLKDRDLPISDICGQSGYFTARCFSRSFKKQEGMTPSEYRNLLNGADGAGRPV